METKRKYNIKNISVILFFITTFFVSACGQVTSQGEKAKTPGQVTEQPGSGK